MKIRPNKTQGVRINLSAKAYWLKFKEVHGGDPVPYNGRLLFQDGWTHSSTDYNGPEYPPPKDKKELQQLRVKYWQIRRACILREKRALAAQIERLERVQESKSAPLQQTSVVLDEDTGHKSLQVEDLDLEPLKGRLSWLEDDAKVCQEMISSIERE